MQVNLHAIARVLQRSVGAADIHAAARVVGPHINLAGKLLETMLCDEEPPAIGEEIGIASAAGVLLFTVEPADGPPVKLLARTWIAADVAVDRQLGTAIAQSRASPSGFTMIYQAIQIKSLTRLRLHIRPFPTGQWLASCYL